MTLHASSLWSCLDGVKVGAVMVLEAGAQSTWVCACIFPHLLSTHVYSSQMLISFRDVDPNSVHFS